VVAGRGDAAGVETTTRHAFAAPRRLGSIPALDVRRHSSGTGPFDPGRVPPTRHHPPVSPRILMESGACHAWLAWAG
jgi:hypothetical protein